MSNIEITAYTRPSTSKQGGVIFANGGTHESVAAGDGLLEKRTESTLTLSLDKHSHLCADVTDLAAVLDTLAKAKHSHLCADVTDLEVNFAKKKHTHLLGDVSQLTEELALRQKIDAEGSAKIKGMLSGANPNDWKIMPDGSADLKSLKIREFLQVDELRFNKVTILTGENWRAAGGGIIQSVDPIATTITLRLEEGEVASLAINDLCKAVFKGETTHYTVFFKIVEKVTTCTFRYELKPGTTYHPQPLMHFVAFGNTSDTSRQRSVVETTSYTRMYTDWSDWERYTIAMAYGDLTGIFPKEKEYAMYVNNILMGGDILQGSSIVGGDGEAVAIVPAMRGEYSPITTYQMGDVVTDGSQSYQYINNLPASGKALIDKLFWLIYVAQGAQGVQGESAYTVLLYSSNGTTSINGNIDIEITALVNCGSRDITAEIRPALFSWRRSSKDTVNDAVWNSMHVGVGSRLRIGNGDIVRSALFECEVQIDGVNYSSNQ